MTPWMWELDNRTLLIITVYCDSRPLRRLKAAKAAPSMTPKASGSRPFLISQPLDFLEGFVCWFVFSSQHEACEILVPRPGTEPLPLSPELGVLTTGLPGKSLFGSVLFLCPTSLKLSKEPESRIHPHRARGGSPEHRCCWGPRPLPPASPLFHRLLEPVLAAQVRAKWSSSPIPLCPAS